MGQKHRKFSREFKIQVVQEIESGIPAAQVSRQYQINPSLIQKWKREYRQYPQTAFAGKGNIYKDEAKIAQLERTIGKLYLENEFLKKTLKQLGLKMEQSKQIQHMQQVHLGLGNQNQKEQG
jgi:transposase